MDSIKSIKIDPKGVESLLKKIQVQKAQDPDNIHNKVPNKCTESLAPAVTIVFQKSLDSGSLPKKWTDTNVSPVYNKGDMYDAEN